ncbi:MAG: multi-sensor hybrid histidine kinase [Bacteroidetes bacterium]|nr:MAG: multi-sensor hybrid histidine kinase [Bacteroidota bacterium]
MDDCIKILFAEDNMIDFEIVSAMLMSELSCEIVRVDKKDAYQKALQEFQPDLVIADFTLDDFNGLDAIKLAKKYDNELQVIVYTGSQSEEIAVKCMRLGASDYVLKSNGKLLPFAIKDALKIAASQKEYQQLLQQLTQSEDKFSIYINHAPEGVFIVDKNGKYCDANKAAIELSGYTKEELFQIHLHEILAPETAEKGYEHFNKLKATGEAYDELLIIKKGEIKVWWAIKAVALPGERYMGFISDVTDRKTHELATQASEKKYRQLVDSMQQGLALHEVITNEEGQVVDYRFLEMNQSFCRLTGLEKDKTIGHTVLELLPDTEPSWIETYGKVALGGEPKELESYAASLDKYYKVNAYSPEYGLFATIVEDVTEKKAISNKLYQSEKLYRLLAENSADVIFVVDLDLKTTYISPSIEKLIGVDAETNKSKSFMDFLTPDSQLKVRKLVEDHFDQELKKEIGSESVITFEYQMIHKDGHLVDVEARVRALRSEEQVIIGFTGTARDISERKQLEKYLIESENRFRKVIEESQAVVWETDKNGLFTYVSPVSFLMSGYKPEELVGKLHFYDLHPEENREYFKQDALQFFAREESFKDVINKIVDKDGRIIIVSSTGYPNYDKNGTYSGYRGVNHDVTARVNAQDELNKSESHLKALMEAATESVFLMDVEGTLLAANKVTAERLGRKQDEIIGLNVFDLIPLETAIFRREKLNKVIETKQTIVFEDFRLGRWINNHIYPVIQEDQVTGFAIYGVDITESKHAGENLLKSEESLRFAQQIAGIGSWEWNLQNGQLFWSDNYYQIIGLKHHEIEPSLDYFLERVHPDDMQLFKDKENEMLTQRTQVSYDFRFIMPDQTAKWLRSITRPIFDEDKLIRLNGVNIDITRRKKEEQLSEVRNRVLSQMNAFAIEMEKVSLEDSYKFIAHKIEEIFETNAVIASSFDVPSLIFQPKAISSSLLRNRPRLEKTINALITKLKININEAQYQEICNAREFDITDSLEEVTFGTMSLIEAKALQKLLKINWFIAIPLFDQSKLQGSLVLCFKDRTDIELYDELKVFGSMASSFIARKMAERQISKSAEQYKVLFESTSDIIAVTYNKKVVFANPRLYELHGLAPGKVLPEYFLGNIHPDDKKKMKLFYTSLDKGIVQKNMLIRSFVEENDLHYFEVSAVPIEWEGQPAILNFAKEVTEQRKSEIEINRLKEDFERVFHATQDSLFLLEVTAENELRYLRNNLTHQNLTGITQEMIQRKTPVELAGEKMGSVIEKNYRKCIDENRIISYEELLLLNGVERLWYTTLMPIEEDGIVNFIVGSSIDITDKKRAEDENKEIAQRLQAITDAAQDGIIMIDDHGMVVFWNKSAEKIFGYKEEEIMGVHLHTVLAPQQYHQEHKNAFEHFVVSGEGAAIGKTLELEGIHQSGHNVPIELGLSALNHKGNWMAVGLVRDITERKKAEKDVEEGTRLKNLLFSVSNDGIVLFSGDHKVHEANERFCQMLGYNEEEIKELHTWDFEYHMKEEDIRKGFGNMGAVDAVFDTVHVRKNRSTYDVEVNAKGFSYADSWYVVCVCKDITERKNAERDLKQKIEDLERFNKLTVGREMKMIELKEEINALHQQLGLTEKYKVIK